MALINCPECKREISDKAASCPHCGYPISKHIIPESQQSNIDEKTDEISSQTNVSQVNLQTKEDPDMIVMKSIGKWASLFVMLFFAFVYLVGKAFFSLFIVLLCALIIISPCADKAGLNIKTKYKVLIVIILFILSIAFIPSEEGSSDIDDTAEASNTLESIPEETIIETDIYIEKETETETFTQIAQPDPIEYEDIFIITLDDMGYDYKGKYVRTSFPIDYVSSSYINFSSDGAYMSVYLDDTEGLTEGQFVTVCGEFDGSSIRDAFIDTCTNSQELYESALTAYTEKKIADAAAYEASFRENAKSVSYDDLSRYPDTYKTEQIKIKVKITDVEPDGIIFDGYYMGVVNGTSNKLSIYDEREIKEPKLIKGDTVTIYGYGNGLSTIKVKKERFLKPSKTVDTYTIPSVEIHFIDIK